MVTLLKIPLLEALYTELTKCTQEINQNQDVEPAMSNEAEKGK